MTENACQIFRLRNLECDGQGPLLAFASKLGRRLIVQMQVEVVPVGADEGGFVAAFAVP